ncbi:MAG: amino acid permease [Verrucomicrobia bacterium]|nr:MAG: amino acid permease [Verrucomicrobiota bacterium]
MIGTGIFTSLGFQVGDLPTGFAIVAVWTVGGLCALCGALSYAELGAALPRSGGEYNFLREIYHPAAGFLAGWVSATVGFAAPVAIAAMAFGTYFAEVVPGTNPLILSLVVVTICTLVLLRDLRLGSAFQNGSTILKVVLILVMIGAGLWVKQTQPVSFLPAKGDGALIMSGPFAVSLYWVMYAYSGWNASTYIVGEVRNPARTIPLSVGLGTVIVMLLYVATNAVFLRVTPAAEMVGKQQVAVIAGSHLFGPLGAKLMASFICLGLISTVSAMMWIGPRITAAMGEDLGLLAPLARRNARGIPVAAILTQFAIVILLLLTATFQTAVNYIQFSLTLCSTLTVLGVFVLRWRRPNLPRPYRTWGYPVTPAIFLLVSIWMLEHMLSDPSTRTPALWGLVTMALGLVLYFLSARRIPASV